jgi:hypothetical protein
LANDIISSIFELLAEYVSGDDISAVSDSTWHGSCLALAELSRRGLLLPDMLKDIMPTVILALRFDQKKGNHSIGAHVRDAACYVCWSFARAYEPNIMRPFVADMANALVVVSVFDREINIRRASSAAFQENVGRQGTFPHGIDIITTADYFTVGNRAKSFLEIAVEISKYSEYRLHMIQHLTNTTIVHWDKNMRELAAETLRKLCVADSEYVIKNTLPKLAEGALNKDLVIRHGCLIGIGRICASLAKTLDLDIDTITLVQGVLDDYPKEYLDNLGSDLTRIAICRYIECLSSCKWEISHARRLHWLSILESSLDRKDEDLQLAVSIATGRFSDSYGLKDDELARFLEMTTSISYGCFRRRGYSLVLGEINHAIFERNSRKMIEALAEAAKVHVRF